MDKKYQDIKVVNILTKQVTLIKRMVEITFIQFGETKIYINYETEIEVGMLKIDKKLNRLIID